MTDILTWCKYKFAAMVRLSTIRGRDSKGVYSCDGYRHPDDPESVVVAKRAQHYGLCSEPPNDGTCVAVAVAVGGGASNRVAVAEYSTNTPEIEEGEVVLWTKFGQVVRLTKDGDVVLIPKAGRKILIGSATGTDPVVLKSELNSVLSTVKTWLNGHIHPTPSGTSSAATIPIGTLSVSGSSNTEAKT